MRYVAPVIAVVALVALFARAPTGRRLLLVVVGVVLLYAILKLTGVVDALAPDRTGVF